MESFGHVDHNSFVHFEKSQKMKALGQYQSFEKCIKLVCFTKYIWHEKNSTNQKDVKELNQSELTYIELLGFEKYLSP